MSASPPRRILSLDCSRVGWFAEGVVVNGEDYVEHRTGTHTGDMLDEHGRPVAKIMDCTPYQIDPAEGLPLSGPTTHGHYVSDDGDRSVLGHVLVPEPRVSGVAVSVALRVKLFDKLVTESCLFWMGTGWGNHFGVRHYRGRTFVECCPDDSLEGWENRVEVGDEMHLEVGRPVAVVATMGACGRMRLYVDGELIAEGVGLGGVRGFSPEHIGRRRACHLGRWFRPDQSFPTSAGLLTCEIFDGEVDAAWVARHWDQTPKPDPPEYVVPPKPPPRAGKAPPSGFFGGSSAPSAPPAPPPRAPSPPPDDDAPTANYEWIKVFEHRAGKGVVLDLGAESINRQFNSNFKCWRYDVNDEPLCYYLRRVDAPSDEFRRFDAYSSMLVTFDTKDNKIHEDFEVYGTEVDAAKKRNKWKTIDQEGPAGFPGGAWFASLPGSAAYQKRSRADVTFAFYIPTVFLGARLVHGKEMPMPPGGRYPRKGEPGYMEPYH